jgi:hypothetical protein
MHPHQLFRRKTICVNLLEIATFRPCISLSVTSSPNYCKFGDVGITVESGLCHPLPDLNRHDASFTATRPNHKTHHDSDACSTARGQSLVPTSKNAFTPSELSQLNASPIEYRSFSNERGRGREFDMRKCFNGNAREWDLRFCPVQAIVRYTEADIC